MMLVQLTSHANIVEYVNMSRCLCFYALGDYTTIEFAEEYILRVKETPEQIIQQMANS